MSYHPIPHPDFFRSKQPEISDPYVLFNMMYPHHKRLFVLPLNSYHSDEYNVWLDKQNKYNSILEIYVEPTRELTQLPQNVKKFTKLQKLKIKGCCWWNLTCENIPKTIQTLDLSEVEEYLPICISSLSSDQLPKLEYLHLDYRHTGLDAGRYHGPFDEARIMLPYLSSLAWVEIRFGDEHPENNFRKLNIKNAIRQSTFFEAYNITSIKHYHNGSICFYKIFMERNVGQYTKPCKHK